ncbi:MAG: SDR family NAD(P)-dependent oxidoreductase [Myxococcota bacterium]
MRDFTNRLAVITGAGSGIGRSLSLGLADLGADVALVDINTDGLAETASMLERSGRRVTTHEADVSDRARMEALADEIEAEHGHVDVLINNAGVSVAGTFEEQTLEDFDWVVGINLWGVVYGCKAFLPLLQRSGEAYIVNLSSVFGLVGVPRQTSYCATKFAVRGFSEALAAELAHTKVKVLSVHPGGINTNIVKASRYRGQSVASRNKVVEMFERRGMSPDRAAAQIIKAMKKKRERVLITREAYGIDAIKRVFPIIPSRVLSWAERRVSGD